MHTFAQKKTPSMQGAASTSKPSAPSQSGQTREIRSILNARRSSEDQVDQQLLVSPGEELEGASTESGGPHPAALRAMPGGTATRSMNRSRIASLFTPSAPGPAAPTIPSSVASTVGSFGTSLLQAAQQPKRASVSQSTSQSARQPTPGQSSNIHSLLTESGAPISDEVRAPFEQAYGYDLSPVRVHTGPHAKQALSALGTVAFTMNDHIVLGNDIDTASRAGRHVLAHELAHTIQGRLSNHRGSATKISHPSWPSEREAERAAGAMLGGHHYEITEGVDEDLQQVAPWVILAGIGLAAGLITWAVSDSPEENRERHAAGEDDPSDSLWALVPIYGSVQQIREAESYFERVLGVGFLMLDLATLGSAGVAARALIRAPAALIRTAATRQGGRLAIREGGEIATEAAARESAEAFTRGGGAVFASEAAATSEIMQALQQGAIVAVTEGGLNHAVLYARNAAGQLLRIHGGPLRVLFNSAPRELTEQAAQGIGRRVNAYAVIEAGDTAVDIERAVASVQGGRSALLRWLGGNPTSCGIVQGALLEASGLPAQTLSRLVPSGGAAARMLPITILDHMAANAGLTLVEGGMGRLIGGTIVQGSMLGAGGAIPTITSTVFRLMVNQALLEEEQAAGRGVSDRGDGSQPSTDVQIPTEPVPQAQISTTVDVFVDTLSDANREGYHRVEFTVRRTATEIVPGFEKLAQGESTRERGELARGDVQALVSMAAQNPVGVYRIVATSSTSGWSLSFETVR